MLDVRVLNKNGLMIAELVTSDLNIATDFVQGQIDKAYYETNENRIGLYDDDYGYYCMLIPNGNEFEIISLEETEPQGNVSLYDAKEFIVHVLEKEDALCTQKF